MTTDIEYKEALKRVDRDMRIVVLHLIERIDAVQSMQYHTFLEGAKEEFVMAVEKELMAHLLPRIAGEIQKEKAVLSLLKDEIIAEKNQVMKIQNDVMKIVRSWENSRK